MKIQNTIMAIALLTLIGCGGSSDKEGSKGNDADRSSISKPVLNLKVGNMSIDAKSSISRVSRGTFEPNTEKLEDIELNLDSVVSLKGTNQNSFVLNRIDDKHYKLSFVPNITEGDYDVDVVVNSTDGQNMTMELNYKVKTANNIIVANNSQIINKSTQDPKILSARMAGTSQKEGNKVVISTENGGEFSIELKWENWMHNKNTYYFFQNTTGEVKYLKTELKTSNTSDKVKCTYKGNLNYSCYNMDFNISKNGINDTNMVAVVCTEGHEDNKSLCNHVILPVVFKD